MYDILNVYLENGLRVIMHKIPYVRTMACGIWVKQGSKYENDDENGLSHLVEHLMINIENDSNQRFKKLINEVSSEGIVYNAGTTKETTSYYFTGLSNMLEKCIETISTIAIDNKTFANELLENEKKVVSQETISFYSSFNQIKERTSQALWGNMGVGKIIVGNLENINNAKISDIENIIKNSYTPENSTLVVVGGIEYQKTLDTIEENFSRWKDTQTRKYKEIVDSEPGIYFNSAGSGKSTAISIGFRTPSYMDAERTNIDIIAKILGDTSLESRLVQEIRMKRGLAYSIGAFTSFYEKRGTIGFTAVCASESVNEVVKIMMDEFHKVKVEGFTDKEINRVKKVLETRTLLDLDDLTSQLKFLGKCTSNGQLFSLEQEIRNIKKSNSESLHKTVQDMFVEEKMGLAAIGNCDVDQVISLLKLN
ncbi:pitrilysin family protein [Clostridium sp. KNHs214]|uniref:M16 family metallopeptidase n=1 Tax=Clostridium sp. KNHs214 TaxID=1540257 RepID=UPI0005545171|nr:pitrilysin family protein [Clostridium sp. KNHs214]